MTTSHSLHADVDVGAASQVVGDDAEWLRSQVSITPQEFARLAALPSDDAALTGLAQAVRAQPKGLELRRQIEDAARAAQQLLPCA